MDGLDRIKTQATGDAGERPDLVGWDDTRDQSLLVEAKFWAALTEKQPNAYLESLPSGGTLLFVAPEARLDALWPELERRVKKKGSFEWTADADNAKTADVGGKRLILTSWRTLLQEIEYRAGAAGDTAAVASVRELHGLCEDQDESAFLPLGPDELGPDVPRRLLDLHSVIKRVVDRAAAADIVGIDKQKVALDGFGRWLELGVSKNGARVKGKPAGACLCVHYTAWSQHGETPIWLEFADAEDGWNVLPLEKVRKRLREQIVAETDETVFVPIHLPTGVELDQVVDSVVDQLRDLAHRLARVKPS